MLKKTNNLRLKPNAKVQPFDPDKYLNTDFIGSAIMECLKNNDPEGVVELLMIYLDECNKVNFFKKADVSRSTMYQAFKHKNPTVKTLAKVVSAAAH